MTRLRRTFGALLAASAVALGGCDDVTVVVLEPSRVEIAPAPLTLDFTESATLTARVLDGEGRELDGYAVNWAVSNPSVATLSGGGVVQAMGEGTTEVTATVEGGPSGSMDVTVAPTRALLVQPGAFEFTATRGASAPAPIQAAVASSGQPIHGLAVAMSASGDGWADVQLSADVTDGTVTVAVDPGDLPAGTYEADLMFSSPVIRDTEVPVRLTVVDPPPPSIRLAPGVIVFQMDHGGSIPLTQVLSVTTDGSSATDLEWDIAYEGEPGGWVTVDIDGRSTPTTALITVTPLPGMEPGDYQATLTVSAPGAQPASLVIALSVADSGGGDPPGGDPPGGDPPGGDPPGGGDPAQFVFNPGSVAFGASTGGSDPAPKQVTIGSDGAAIAGLDAAITYAAGQETGWLSATLNGATSPTSLDLTATTGALPAGTYNAQVEVTGTDVAPKTLPVTFVVSDVTPVVGVSPAALDIEAGAGVDPADAEIAITALAGSVAGISAAVAFDEGGPDGWLDVSLSSDAAPSVATASFDVDGLSEGTYGATITISAAGADDVIVPVELEVSEDGLEIVVPVPTVEVVLPLGGELIGLIPIPVLNVGAVGIDDLTADVTLGPGEPDWLTADVTALAGPGLPALLTLDAGAGMGSLSTGTYTADITVRSELYGTVAVGVRVILHVVDLGDVILAVDPGGISLEATVGGASVDADVTVKGLLPGLLGALGVVQISADIEYQGSASGWLDADIDDSSLTLLGPNSTMSLSADPSGLAPGRYEAIVRVDGSILGLSPLTVGSGAIRVYLNVSGS